MKKKFPRYGLILLGVVLTGLVPISCSQKDRQSPATPDQSQSLNEKQYPGLIANMPGTINVAEQIIYDVEIINPYPDDLWTMECLEGLDHESLVNFVFEGIYSGQFSSFDIFEGTPISSRKIRRMEENREFTRDQIGKFQFMEKWILDTVRMTYFKEVTEIRMGIQKFDDHGELTGYAPLLRVVL